MAIDYKSIADLIKPEEKEPMMSEMAPADYENMQSPVAPEMAYSTPKLADVLPPEPQQPEAPMLAEADTQQAPPSETPMSKSEALIAEYNKMLGRDQQALEDARSRDRMLKVGGSIGDALATYLNAQGQKNVKAPGVQVQQGAGLGKVADMFATAPEIQSDVAARREALMKQYAELAKGERAQARLTSEEVRARDADLRARELAKMQIEGSLKEAGIKASGKSSAGFTPYQEKQIKREDEKDLQKLSASVTKLGLPTITTAINSLENQLGMTLEEALSRNTDEDETNDIEVPGYGRVGSLYPSKFVGNESRAFRQDVNSLLNPQISKQFGASQTKGEIERFQEEVGGGKFESQATILKVLANIKRSAKADLNTVYAGFKPELVDTYKNRKGVNLQEYIELDPRVENFMKKNNITDKDEAIRILKENKKL
jgi:hypothetical protein